MKGPQWKKIKEPETKARCILQGGMRIWGKMFLNS